MSDAEWDSSTRERNSDKPKLTLKEVAFPFKEAQHSDIEWMIKVAKTKGINYWDDADHLLCYISSPETNIMWFDEEAALNGNDEGDAHGRVIVDYQTFECLFKQRFLEEEQINGIPEGFIYHDGKSAVGDKDRKVKIVVREGDVLDGRVGEFRWNHYGNDRDIVAYRLLDDEPAPALNPRPRYRKRSRQKPTVAKTIVRVLYTTQQVYTFKNVRSVQVIDGTVYIQHEREVTEGIKESIETEIDEKLLMAVVIHDVGNRSSFLRNIDGSWDYQAEDGTVINGGKQLGRIFKK
jgi:hypothetical protein